MTSTIQQLQAPPPTLQLAAAHAPTIAVLDPLSDSGAWDRFVASAEEIGRASCRERVSRCV